MVNYLSMDTLSRTWLAIAPSQLSYSLLREVLPVHTVAPHFVKLHSYYKSIQPLERAFADHKFYLDLLAGTVH